MTHQTARKQAFTLVELLVVIGIISLLISVLLPALNAARAAAQSLVCSSNARQLALGGIMFAQEHRGYLPPSSDTFFATFADPQHIKFSYRDTGAGDKLKDWASALLPYLGDKTSVDFQQAPPNKTKAFVCPSDPGMDMPQPGHKLWNNVTNGVNGGYQSVSYATNADITCLLDSAGTGRFSNDGNTVSVFAGPKDSGGRGQPLNCRYNRIYSPSTTLFYAECGTRPRTTGSLGAPLNDNEALYYTSNFLTTGGTLQNTAVKVNLKDRIPYERHRKGINVAFADGHVEMVLKSNFNLVRVSPYRY